MTKLHAYTLLHSDISNWQFQSKNLILKFVALLLQGRKFTIITTFIYETVSTMENLKINL